MMAVQRAESRLGRTPLLDESQRRRLIDVVMMRSRLPTIQDLAAEWNVSERALRRELARMCGGEFMHDRSYRVRWAEWEKRQSLRKVLARPVTSLPVQERARIGATARSAKVAQHWYFAPRR